MANKDGLSWWAVGGVTVLAGLVLVIPDPIPLSGVAAVSLTTAAWASKLGLTVPGFTSPQPAAKPRENPVPLLALAAVAIPLVVGAGAAGATALYFYNRKKAREEVQQSIQDSPLRFINPAVFAAAGGLLPYFMGLFGSGKVTPSIRQTVSGVLVGGTVGYAAQKLITEVMYTYHDVPAGDGAVERALGALGQDSDMEVFDVEAEEVG